MSDKTNAASGIRGKLGNLSTARRRGIDVPGVGKLLFVEPFLAEIRETQRQYLVYVEPDPNDPKASARVDTERSDMDAYNNALIALTARDEETKARIFSGPEDVASLFAATDEEGFPRVGAPLFAKFVGAAVYVCGLDTDDATKKAEAKGK